LTDQSITQKFKNINKNLTLHNIIPMKKHLNRRTFIKNTSLGAMAGPLLIRPGKDAEKSGLHTMAYKTLGRTGFLVQSS
jgi:hypothetical protein